MKLRFMERQPLQWLTATARATFGLVQKQLYHACCAIVLVSVILSSEGLLLPSTSAQAGSIRLADAAKQVVLAAQPINSTSAQLPSSLANRLRQALSKQTKTPTAKLNVVQATPRTWTDSCLGLARSDEFCTQALVQGWRVIFSSGSQRWTYRTDQQGHVYRLEP